MEIMRYLEEINKSGTTIIVATHDRDIVNTMHKRVIEVNYGTVVRDEMVGGYAEND
jgi:cell division transport system ATP-binding protein